MINSTISRGWWEVRRIPWTFSFCRSIKITIMSFNSWSGLITEKIIFSKTNPKLACFIWITSNVSTCSWSTLLRITHFHISAIFVLHTFWLYLAFHTFCTLRSLLAFITCQTSCLCTGSDWYTIAIYTRSSCSAVHKITCASSKVVSDIVLCISTDLACKCKISPNAIQANTTIGRIMFFNDEFIWAFVKMGISA